mmetsp:Transcript_44174/g.56593  ORF Transcript_44174/g.56593 Transcript_44174/m.56593 type:complete len:280 (-) Transcript_44174:49-888(-)
MDTTCLLTNEGRLEENLWATESLVSDNDNVSVRKLVTLFESRGLSSSLHFSIEVKSNEGELLLYITYDLTLSSGGERVTTLGKDLHHVVGKIAASKIKTYDSMRKSVTFVDRYGVGYTISGVHYATSGTSGSVKGENSLDVYVHSRYVEGLEHDLGHALTVSLWVKRSLGKENRMLLRSYAKLVVESVMPDLFHIIPVGYDTVFNRVFQGQDTTLGLSLISDVCVLLVHANHDSRVLWATNNGWENCARCIITSETSFAHSGTIVHYKSLYFFIISHFE